MTDRPDAAVSEAPNPPPKWAFGGPWGALGLTIVLPILVFYLWVCIEDHGGALFIPTTAAEWVALVKRIPVPTVEATLIYGAWFVLQVLLQVFMPGEIAEGTLLRDGTRAKYKMNGRPSWWLTLVVVIGLAALGVIPPTLFYDHYGPLLATVTVFTYVYSAYLYWHGKRYGRGERTYGNPIHDYFMGTSLNPRTGNFDHKLFCEARPGLILWVLANFSLAAKQYQLYGTVTTPILLVCFFHFWYIADYFSNEPAILTTWDVKHENFGFMLCFGDLVWVPFTYTYQAYYLVNHLHELPWWGTVGIVALNLAGFVVFRASNIQKHRFRTDPQRPVWGKPPRVIKTERGTHLLISGWWGLARHINYLGDLAMGLAWCLPCLFDHLVPYYYIIYFTILLVLRERRDNRMCREKYGKAWEEYSRRVRWRIIPYLY